MLFTTNWLSSIFEDGTVNRLDDKPIKEVFSDSRTKVVNGLFVPIIGENFDGHQFIHQAVQNGALATLWDKQKVIPTDLEKEVTFILVDDTVKALQKLAAEYRMDVNPTVIGVTGSNGKTTTKDMVAAVAKSNYRTHYTDGNYNNEIGLPLTILSMPRDTEVLVLEMGMSAFGEIELLSKIAKPDYGIITNIGESHIEYLGSRNGIANAKLEIVRGMNNKGTLIIDGDEPLLQKLHTHTEVIMCGFQKHNQVIINPIQIEQQNTNFTLSDNTSYSIPLLGKHHAKNASFAVTVGKLLHIDQSSIQHALDQLSITSMRFELVEGKNGVSIINDAYNASPTSMKAAIEVVKEIQGYHEKILVLGDIFELGSKSKEFHQSVAEVISEPITALYTIGKDSEIISSTVEEKSSHQIHCLHFDSKDELVSFLEERTKPDTVILFKASRGMKFEDIIQPILD